MIHDVIKVGGLEYKAVKESEGMSCYGCYFDAEGGCDGDSMHSYCCSQFRKDHQDVIFKRHYKLKDCK